MTAVVGLITAERTARAKESEFQIRRHDSYREAARAHTCDIYLPLNAELNKLTEAYPRAWRRDSRLAIASDSRSLDRAHRRQAEKAACETRERGRGSFEAAVNAFLANIPPLTKCGRDAYLTPGLADRLRDFQDFLARSHEADAVQNIPVPAWRRRRARAYEDRSTFGRLLVITKRHKTKVIAAPLGSLEFDDRFQFDTEALRDSIREVTLGADRPNAE